MELHALFADIPIRKSYLPAVIPYPNIRNFASSFFQVTSTSDFFSIVKNVSEQGGCLLKGLLTRPLVNESRAGLTSPLPTGWVCFDFDGLTGIEDIDDVLDAIGFRPMSSCSWTRKSPPRS